MSASAIYEGTVAHRRLEPREHRLAYPVFMTLLDLDELPEALDQHPLWSARRLAPVRFRPSDYLMTEGLPPSGSPAELAARARSLAAADSAEAPDGPVRLLSMPRMLGVGFNPVSFLFLYDEHGERVEAVIAEVTSTPWGERHAYVARRRDEGGPIRAEIAKRMHVSPFNPMEQTYELTIGEPGPSLEISIRNRERGRVVFGAGLTLRRRELNRTEMSRAIRRYPPAAIAALARIYGHGLRLKLKGVPHYPHTEADAPTG